MSKLKILLLENNEADALIIVEKLKKSGLEFEFKIGKDKAEYEEMLDDFLPDIILSDYYLPEFDGVAAFHIKQKSHSNIPFIIVSGIIGGEDATELIKLGINDYSAKSGLHSLNQKIKRSLNDAANQRAKRLADEKIMVQNEKLLEIAFLQMHQVRAPVANILGLCSLFNESKPSDPINAEILPKLKIAAENLDSLVKQITEKTNEIYSMQTEK